MPKNKETFRELPIGSPLSFPMLLQSPFLQLDTPEGVFNIQLRNILYCQGDGAFTTFYTRVTNPVTVLKPLKHFEHLLGEYGFERIQDKRLINLTHIMCYNHLQKGYELELTSGERISVSRAVKKSLTEALSRISTKEERISKQEDWQMINDDFILRDIARSSDFNFRHPAPRRRA